jgi:hypothetical protein
MDAYQAQELTNKALSDKMSKEQAEARQKELDRQSAIAEAKRGAAAHLDSLADRIAEEANKGYREIRLSYNERTDALKFQALAEEAQHRGFHTKFHVSETDYGDSAAPAWSTDYYLIISWGPVNVR